MYRYSAKILTYILKKLKIITKLGIILNRKSSGRQYGMPDIDDAELEAELDALGDGLMLDDDMSYLDEAADAPTAAPGSSQQVDPSGTQLDEFGLPALS